MSSPLPFVVRVAAGLLTEAADTLRRLPEELPGLPIALAGRAARLSMRLNQQLAELADKGDSTLAGLPFGGGGDAPVERTPWSRIDDEDNEEDSSAASVAQFDSDAGVAGDAPGPKATFDSDDAQDVEIGPDSSGSGQDPAESTGRRTQANQDTTVNDAPAEPLAGYQKLTVAKLKSKLTSLTVDQVDELLTYERANGNRAPFLTLLSNRLVSLSPADRE